jgi:hypothetical protein
MARIPPPEGAQQRQTLNKQKEILLQTRLSDDSPRSISLSEGSTKVSLNILNPTIVEYLNLLELGI